MSCDVSSPCFQDELLSKKKKEKKKKVSVRPAEELRCFGQEQTDRYASDIIFTDRYASDIIFTGLPVCWFITGARTDPTGRTSSL